MTTQAKTLQEQLQFGLGDRLAKALHVANVSSNEMAAELYVSRTTISNYLNGRTKPKGLYLRIWALKTGVPLEWLETGHFPTDPENKESPRPENPDEGNRAAYQNRTGDLFITSGTLAPVIPLWDVAA